MRYSRWFLACTLALVPFDSLHAAPAPGQQTVQKEYTLPKDKQAVVVMLDFKGGFTPRRLNDKPTFTILADGTVKIPARFEGQKSYDAKVSPAELQELLEFAIEKQKFFEHDDKKVQEKIAQKGEPQFRIADAPTTVIRIQADGKDKTVSHYALGQGSDIEELKRLGALQHRLRQVMSTVQLGGKEQVLDYLKQANAALVAKHPKAAPMTLEDFQLASEQANGSRFVQFVRQANDAEGKQLNFTAVSFNQPPEGKAEITVNYVEGK